MLRFTFNENDIHFELRTTHISPTIVTFWARIVITCYGTEVVLEDQVTLIIPPGNIVLLENWEENESMAKDSWMRKEKEYKALMKVISNGGRGSRSGGTEGVGTNSQASVSNRTKSI